MSTRKDQLLRRAAGQKGRTVALTREEKALRALLEQMHEEHSQIPDMTEYAKKTDIPTIPDMTEYAKKTDIPTVPDMTEYAKKTDIPTVPDMTEYAKKTDIPTVPDISGLATETYVTDTISAAITGAMEASY